MNYAKQRAIVTISLNMEDENKTTEELEFVPDEEGDTPELQQKIKKLKSSFKKCESERKEYLEGWQRAKADFINYRNDEGKRFEDMGRFVSTSLIQEMLPALDSFDLALHSFQLPAIGEARSWRPVSGSQSNEEHAILLIRAQFLDILRKRGLEEIIVAEGEEFNPEKHESVGEIESKHPAGTVAEAVQKGYTLRGKVIRPARVRIVK